MKPTEPRDATLTHDAPLQDATPQTPEVTKGTSSASSVEPGQAQRPRNDVAESPREARDRQIQNAYFDAKYGANIREIRSEVAKLQDLVQNSGRLRLGWLKLTKQVSSDPHRDLHTLTSYVEKYEHEWAEELRVFEYQRAERQDNDAKPDPTPQVTPDLRRIMTAYEARLYVDTMEDANIKPMPELYRRAGQRAPLQTVGNIAVGRFVNDNLPRDLGPASEDADFGVDFEPPF